MKADLRFTTSIAAALLAAGCDRTPRQQPDGWVAQRDTAVCTDAGGRRVADDQCGRRGGGYAGGGGHWYFLGRNGVVPPYGEPVRGGSYARAPGRAYGFAPAVTQVTRAGAISRGGFGASAHSFGGARA